MMYVPVFHNDGRYMSRTVSVSGRLAHFYPKTSRSLHVSLHCCGTYCFSDSTEKKDGDGPQQPKEQEYQEPKELREAEESDDEGHPNDDLVGGAFGALERNKHGDFLADEHPLERRANEAKQNDCKVVISYVDLYVSTGCTRNTGTAVYHVVPMPLLDYGYGPNIYGETITKYHIWEIPVSWNRNISSSTSESEKPLLGKPPLVHSCVVYLIPLCTSPADLAPSHPPPRLPPAGKTLSRKFP